jgi:hypothetical protein
VAYQAILRRKLPSEALSEHREDVLTATVIGAVAYGPPEMVTEGPAAKARVVHGAAS